MRILPALVSIACFSGVVGAQSTGPPAEEIWRLVREIYANYAAIDAVDYEITLRSPEVEAMIMARAGGLPIAPQFRMARTQLRTEMKIAVPDLPEPFRSKAESKLEKELERVETFALFRNAGWNFLGAFLKMIDAGAQYDLLEWDDARAVVEFNDLGEPLRNKVIRSARFTFDRRRMTIDTIALWMGGSNAIELAMTYSADEFFPGSRTPLMKTMRIAQSGFNGPPVATIVAESGAYRLSATTPEAAELIAWKTKAQQAGMPRWVVEKIRREPDGKLRMDLSETGTVNLALFQGWPIRDLNLAKTSVTDLTPLAGMPLEVLNLDETPVANLAPLRGLPLKTLSIRKTKVADFAALQGLPLQSLVASENPAITSLASLAGLALTSLDLEGTPVSDLQPLRGMPLLELFLNNTQARDLSPLRGAPLERLELRGTKVEDLAALADCAGLQVLRISQTPVQDLTPLRQLKLTILKVGQSRVRDLEPLRGMPLKTISIDQTGVTSLSPLLDCPTLEGISLPKKARNLTALRALPKLAYLSYRWDNGQDRPAQTTDEFWKEFDPRRLAREEAVRDALDAALRDAGFDVISSSTEEGALSVALDGKNVSDLKFLSGFPIEWLSLARTKVADLSPLRGMPLKYLSVRETQVRDLSPLAALPIEFLILDKIPATDFSVLKGMKLKRLNMGDALASDLEFVAEMPLEELVIWGCKNLSDLSPVRKLPLTHLNLGDTNFTDLSPLRGKGLKALRLHGSKATNLRPLAECRDLESLLMPRGATDIEVLRSLPKLKELMAADKQPPRIQAAEEFWKEYDASTK